MFRTYFICPLCNEPIIAKEGIQDAVEEGSKYCPHCGRKIANAFAEALAEIKKEKTAN